MKPSGTLILRETEVDELLSMDACIEAVEDAFRLHAEGRSLQPGLLQVESGEGDFHIKAGGLVLEKPYFCLKANGSFFGNSKRFAMPNIQGIILLSDGETGYPLAVFDSRAITRKRTAAATAVAAKYLAQKDSRVVTLCGAGTQAAIHLRALAPIFPLQRAFLYAPTSQRAEQVAQELTTAVGFPVCTATDLQAALAQSQISVTCTPAREYYVRQEDVPPGMFLAAVGADGHGKQEIDPRLLLSATVVADLCDQALRVGELQHAAALGLRKQDIHAELADVVSHRKPGRTSDEEITIFDSTGTGLQDAAAAIAVYRKAIETNRGQVIDLFS